MMSQNQTPSAMKNFILSIAALLLVETSVFSQVSIGVKTGVNFAASKFKTEAFYEKHSGSGFHGGVYVNTKLNKTFSIQTEVLYNSLTVVVDDQIITSGYISNPVMLVVGFFKNRINVQAGPQIGMLVSMDPKELKELEIYKGGDFTVNVGVGFNVKKFNATIRYGVGLANIAGDSLTQHDPDYSIKYDNLQVSVGYRIFGSN